MNKYSIFGLAIIFTGIVFCVASLIPSSSSDVTSRIADQFSAKDNASQSNFATEKHWRLVGNFPVDISGISFYPRIGPNGEEAKSGEVIIPHIIHVNWEYKITFVGAYERRYQENWYTVGWEGNGIEKDPNLPFPNIDPGKLVLRIGMNSGFSPPKENGEIKYLPLRNSLLYARLNIKELQSEYIDLSGSKIKNSTLSIKIERRRI